MGVLEGQEEGKRKKRRKRDGRKNYIVTLAKETSYLPSNETIERNEEIDRKRKKERKEERQRWKEGGNYFARHCSLRERTRT